MKHLFSLILCAMLMLGVVSGAMAYEAGDIVTFGHYDQDNDPSNGKEPIEWVVVDTDEEQGLLFLMSLKCLDAHYYNQKFIAMTWARCDLRRWLNNEFLNEAFTPEEQEQIAVTHVINEGHHGNPGGDDTDDQIYLLSYREVLDYYPTMAERVAYPTETCIADGCYVDSKTGACWWWLRSPGTRAIDACGVRVDGRVSGYGSRDVYRPSGALRPVMWAAIEE